MGSEQQKLSPKQHTRKTVKVELATKIAFALAMLSAAIAKLVFHESIGPNIDVVFMSMIAIAFLILIVPFDYLKTLKAGPIEISIETPEAKAALDGLGLERIEGDRLRIDLKEMQSEIEVARGGRVLWIDDKPHNVLGARRLLRALGIDVTTATSSEMASELLEVDNDFDLIVTDVQRRGTYFAEVEGGLKDLDGVNFVVAGLRRHADPNIQKIPVIFYAAFGWDSLVKYTRPARELLPEPEIANSLDRFVPLAIKRLAQQRSTPIKFEVKKKPTSAG